VTMDPGAGEYGCSLVECWVAEIGRTHLDRDARQVARQTTWTRPSQKVHRRSVSGLARNTDAVDGELEAKGCASRCVESLEDNVQRLGPRLRKHVKDVAIRWKASWVVGCSPFTGCSRGGPGQSGESETRVALVARREARGTAAANGLGACESCLGGDRGRQRSSGSEEAPPVRSTRNEGGQHPRRTSRKAVCRAVTRRGRCRLPKGYRGAPDFSLGRSEPRE